ncbi:MotA/TolQ/ExbB proton channel family protein [Ectothiorhodospira mobilis]|uniref:MotA/TolQ/ExbB proton channel family protein n=1 Tax=Ectothiorhodospira mobilis TaxID=195064 RepID=UPI0019079937
MFELVKAGGWLMLPILACSVLALAIVLERLWSLRRRRVVPPRLVVQIWQWLQAGELDDTRLRALREGSPLGRILASGLVNRGHSREVMKESIEDTGRQVAHELERFLNTLGTIAAVTPLLGLLGTVLGMIQVFSVITAVGVGDPGELAGGISQALITTAAGISVAVPSLVFHRYFRGRVDELVLEMEQEAIRLVEVLKGERGDAEVTQG